MIREDYWNYCPRCDLIIDTDDMFKPACRCITEVEEWTDEEFREGYNDLPRHVREYFTPPSDEIPPECIEPPINFQKGDIGHPYNNIEHKERE